MASPDVSAHLSGERCIKQDPKFTLSKLGFMLLGLSMLLALVLFGGNKFLSLVSLLFSTYVQAFLGWIIAATFFSGLIMVCTSVIKWFIVNPKNLSPGKAIIGGVASALLSIIVLAFTGLYLFLFLAFGPGDSGKLVTHQQKQYFAIQTDWLDPDRYSCYEAQGYLFMSSHPKTLDYYELFGEGALEAE